MADTNSTSPGADNTAARGSAWLYPGFIPRGQLSTVDGDPGLGKSCVMVDIAARVTRGRPMPLAEAARAAAPADVVILSAEDSEGIVRARLEAAEGEPSRLHFFDSALGAIDQGAAPPDPKVPLAPGARLLLPRDLPRLRDLLRRTGARLLVIDPLVAFLEQSVQWHMDQSVRRLLHLLSGLAKELDVAVVVIRHLNKQTNLKALYRGGGAIAIVGAARSALLIVEDPDDRGRRLFVTLKSNLAAAGRAARYTLAAAGDTVRVTWLDECPVDTNGLLCRPPLPEEAGAIAEAMEFLKGMLQGGTQHAADVLQRARTIGISEATLKRAKHKLGVVSRFLPSRISAGGFWLWELPPSPPPSGAADR